jgi:hypothetical protein
MLKVNQILQTKDGRKLGNAIVIKDNGMQLTYDIKTDYGNELKGLTEKEIRSYFYIPNMVEFFNIEEHKHYVK